MLSGSVLARRGPRGTRIELPFHLGTEHGPVFRIPADEGPSSCSMRAVIARPIETPAESQYRFHIAHFAAVAGTRNGWSASLLPRPAKSFRSILAKVP